jgi:hypothetical protein
METFTINSISGGDCFFAVRVKDKANLESDISNTVSVYVPADSTIPSDISAPVISALSPSGTVASDSTTLSAVLSDNGSGVDPASITVKLDGIVLDGCSVTSSSVSCAISGLSYGSTHKISVFAQEMAVG